LIEFLIEFLTCQRLEGAHDEDFADRARNWLCGSEHRVRTAAGHAQTNYPWCARYGNGTGGGMNCGFTTFEQCLATVHGIGGFCEKNDWYRPPPGPPGL
jgi:Protein of unknown function (DUF3551)